MPQTEPCGEHATGHTLTGICDCSTDILSWFAFHRNAKPFDRLKQKYAAFQTRMVGRSPGHNAHLAIHLLCRAAREWCRGISHAQALCICKLPETPFV
jgi:hypothetical protein